MYGTPYRFLHLSILRGTVRFEYATSRNPITPPALVAVNPVTHVVPYEDMLVFHGFSWSTGFYFRTAPTAPDPDLPANESVADVWWEIPECYDLSGGKSGRGWNGLRTVHGAAMGDWSMIPYHLIEFPSSMIYLPLMLSPIALFAGNRWHSRRRVQNHLCSTCSYDLRSHKPGDKCAECGAPVASSAQSNC
jgi:hypothetical protein